MNKINLMMIESLFADLKKELAEAEKIESMMSSQKTGESIMACVAAYSKVSGLVNTIGIETDNLKNDFKTKIEMMLNPAAAGMASLMNSLLPQVVKQTAAASKQDALPDLPKAVKKPSSSN